MAAATWYSLGGGGGGEAEVAVEDGGGGGGGETCTVRVKGEGKVSSTMGLITSSLSSCGDPMSSLAWVLVVVVVVVVVEEGPRGADRSRSL